MSSVMRLMLAYTPSSFISSKTECGEPNGQVLAGAKSRELPLCFRHRLNRRVESLAHARADGKAHAPARPVLPLLMAQPIHQATFVTGRITPIVILVHRAGHGGKGPLRDFQRLHLRRHMAVAKLVGQYQIFRPG